MSDAGKTEDAPHGATGDKLRLWRAKEAVRHGELRLSGQHNNLSAMETRATSIFGWSIPTVLALGALTASGSYCFAPVLGMASLSGAAILAAIALWPKDWGLQGQMPKVVMDDDLETEMESLESFALSYQDTIESNEAILDEFGRSLQKAWFWFISAPVAAGIGLLLDRLILS